MIVIKIFKYDLLNCQQTARTKFERLKNAAETTSSEPMTDFVFFIYEGL
jgi:hypothetical protein